MLFAIFRKKDLVIRNLNRNFASEVQQKKGGRNYDNKCS